MTEPLDARAAEQLRAEIARPLTVYDYDVTTGGQFDLWKDVFPPFNRTSVELKLNEAGFLLSVRQIPFMAS